MIRWLAAQKFYIDQGMNITSQFTAIIQAALLMVVIEDKFKHWTGINDMRLIVLLFGGGYLFFMWALGYVLDQRGFFTHYVTEYNRRNAALSRASKMLEDEAASEASKNTLPAPPCFVKCKLCGRVFYLNEGDAPRWQCLRHERDPA